MVLKKQENIQAVKLLHRKERSLEKGRCSGREGFIRHRAISKFDLYYGGSRKKL